MPSLPGCVVHSPMDDRWDWSAAAAGDLLGGENSLALLDPLGLYRWRFWSYKIIYIAGSSLARIAAEI